MHLRLPYVQIWNVLHFDVSGSTPLMFYSWPHETNPEALARNVKGLQILRQLGEPMMPIVRSYAERMGSRSIGATRCHLIQTRGDHTDTKRV